MAKMTKTQMRRAYLAMMMKARKVWLSGGQGTQQAGWTMTTQDMIAIEKICAKYLKKF